MTIENFLWGFTSLLVVIVGSLIRRWVDDVKESIACCKKTTSDLARKVAFIEGRIGDIRHDDSGG